MLQANWRIKVLESQIQKQKLQWQLMHSQVRIAHNTNAHYIRILGVAHIHTLIARVRGSAHIRKQ